MARQDTEAAIQVELEARDLESLVQRVEERLEGPATLYLVAATSHLWEGWWPRVARFELAGENGGGDQVERAVREMAASTGIDVVWESPASVIPLPQGYMDRARPAHRPGVDRGRLNLKHFDPYSVALRLVTRGDEPDYRVALRYLEHGWVTWDALEASLAEVLPRFSNETIQQDPAEFRRKFRGLRQLWRASLARVAGAR